MTPTPLGPQQQIPSTLSGVQSIIAVSSCKGGVGKSTVAAHLATALTKQGKKVGLVDVDIHGPSIPSLFNLNNQKIFQNEKKQFIPVDYNGTKIMSFGFLLGDAPAVLRGPLVVQYASQVLHNTDWGQLDYLLIDMPPGTGDVQLTITQTAQLSGAVIVTTPQTLSLIDVARGILMFEKVNVPILGVIENMAYFICTDCSKKHYVFGKQGHQMLTDRFGVSALAEIPMSENMADLGTSESNAAYDKAAQAMLESLENIQAEKDSLSTLKYDAEKITLGWNNGEKIVIPNRRLRLNCQCALCVNEVTGAQILKEEDVKEDIAPTAITPLGNYALGITWNDRHSSGIYPYAAIKKLMQTV